MEVGAKWENCGPRSHVLPMPAGTNPWPKSQINTSSLSPMASFNKRQRLSS